VWPNRKHGTFRPNLLKLAESNSEDDIKKTTLDAFETYKKDSSSTTKAINKLTSLKGIGPATASLLLSVHDAARVPFFSDELYQWVCHGGKKVTIKYNMKEYEGLVAQSREIIDRLAVDARDLEKVAFVLIKEASSDQPAAEPNGTSAAPKAPKEKKVRNAEAKPSKEPTDMTEERKTQLVEIAAKGRAARVAKKMVKMAKGSKFRERVDAARERRKDEPSTPLAKAGVKRKSEVTTRGLASAAKRSRKSAA
jgi:hypothetical protein